MTSRKVVWQTVSMGGRGSQEGVQSEEVPERTREGLEGFHRIGHQHQSNLVLSHGSYEWWSEATETAGHGSPDWAESLSLLLLCVGHG